MCSSLNDHDRQARRFLKRPDPLNNPRRRELQQDELVQKGITARLTSAEGNYGKVNLCRRELLQKGNLSRKELQQGELAQKDYSTVNLRRRELQQGELPTGSLFHCFFLTSESFFEELLYHKEEFVFDVSIDIISDEIIKPAFQNQHWQWKDCLGVLQYFIECTTRPYILSSVEGFSGQVNLCTCICFIFKDYMVS